MKTRAFLFALPLIALAACRDNRASIQIQAICAPSDDCTFSGECGAQYIGFATIDATQTNRLWLFLQLENQLQENPDASRGKLNTNDAHVDQVAIEYDGIGLGKGVYDLPNYHVPAAGTAVISVDVVPAAANLGATLLAFAPATGSRTFVAYVRLRGYLDDGSRFETGEFPIGVQVCQGCVPGCSATQSSCPPGSEGQLPLTCIDPTGAGTT